MRSNNYSGYVLRAACQLSLGKRVGAANGAAAAANWFVRHGEECRFLQFLSLVFGQGIRGDQ